MGRECLVHGGPEAEQDSSATTETGSGNTFYSESGLHAQPYTPSGMLQHPGPVPQRAELSRGRPDPLQLCVEQSPAQRWLLDRSQPPSAGPLQEVAVLPCSDLAWCWHQAKVVKTVPSLCPLCASHCF